MMDYATHPGVKAKASPLPRHVAIIMDGNGRWAASRKLSHTSGHRKGVEVARDVIFACQDRGIEALTLFAFGIDGIIFSNEILLTRLDDSFLSYCIFYLFL